MDSDLSRVIRQARRRLWLNRWFSGLGWAAASAAGVFVLLVVLNRCVLALDEDARLLLGVAGALAAAGLLVSGIWTLVTRENASTAAALLDLAAGLKERLSSGLYCQSSEDPFARAVAVDARRTARGLSVRQHLPVRVPASAGYAGASLLAAGLVFLLFPAVDLAGKEAAREEERQRREAIERVAAQVKPVMEDELQRLAAAKKVVQEAMKDLDPVAASMPAHPDDIRNNAVHQLNRIGDRLQQRRDATEQAGVAEFKKMLRQLSTGSRPTDSPVGRLAQALADGDLKNARDALEALRRELDRTPQTPEEKQRAEELKAQLDQLSQALARIAENDRKMQTMMAEAGLSEVQIAEAMESLRKGDMDSLARKLTESGLSPEQAEKLSKKLASRSSACEAMKKMASSLGSACRGSGSQRAGGGQARAGESQAPETADLQAAGQQLSAMEALEQELGQIQSAMSAVAGMRNSLCGSGGPSESGQPGPGMGDDGQGEGGIAPREPTAIRTVKERSAVHTLGGAIISQRFVEGEQYRGEVSDEYVEAVISAQRDTAEATLRKPLPRHLQHSRSQYFSSVLKDLPPEKLQAERAENAPPPAPASSLPGG